MQDLSALKKRYGIPDKAKMSKIAGLMAYAIVKFKPLIPINGRFLAIFYGLCVCADLGNGIPHLHG